MYAIAKALQKNCAISGPECSGAPKLASLPPTNENVVHAHLQVAFWWKVLQPDPSEMDPIALRWSLEDEPNTLSNNSSQ